MTSYQIDLLNDIINHPDLKKFGIDSDFDFIEVLRSYEKSDVLTEEEHDRLEMISLEII